VKKILAMFAVAAILLTGCSQVGAAATVGGTKITQATVQGSIDSILAERAKVDTTQMQLDTGEALKSTR
jgi:PBP1b-binding outer membrane lipoprotein LpoB